MTNSADFRRWWMPGTRRASPERRLFCFPFAGGSASLYSTWPAHLPESVEVWSLKLPGRDNRMQEACPRKMSDVVEPLAATLEKVDDLPFALFGYSLGALIAFETARTLRRRRHPLPDALLIAACPAPQTDHAREPLIHRLPEERFRAELRRFQGTPEAVLANEEFMAILGPVIRADFEVLETYVAADEPPLPIPIAAFGGISDDDVRSDELAMWSEQTSAGFTLQFFPGDHFFLKTSTEALLAAVVRELR